MDGPLFTPKPRNRHLVERGQVKPLVDEVLPLNRVGEAHERLESGHGRGKVVLRVSEG
ncbi:MAG: zinc-binding dehydrogenase [Actinomycetota bacterium]|nr:zinc-binding dehydrogenase [Actinomycetota bacterium]